MKETNICLWTICDKLCIKYTIKHTGKYIPITWKPRGKKKFKILKFATKGILIFSFLSLSVCMCFILFCILFWDNQWGVTIRRKRGEAQEKTKTIMLTGPIEMVTHTKGDQTREHQGSRLSQAGDKQAHLCFYWGVRVRYKRKSAKWCPRCTWIILGYS